MTVRKPYRRSMAGWWRKNPFFVRYMLRELTAPFVAIYAVILLVGLVRLAQGEAAYDAWFAALTHPASIAIHWLLLVAVIYHSVTMWQVMPKAMPPLKVAGHTLPELGVTALGLLATLTVSVVVYALVRWL